MTFPPPPPASQNSIASSTNKTLSARPGRVPQSVWGLPAPTASARRGLTPLATNVGSSSLDSGGRRSGPSNSPSLSAATASPFTSTFSSVLNSANRVNNSRHTSSASSSASPFTPQQTGSQQLHTNQLLSSPRSQANTPSLNTYLASSAAVSITASQGGGGGGSGGGGSSRNVAFSPSSSQQSLTSPINTTFDRSPFTTSNIATPTSSQSSVSKIVVTQVFLLLGSITEKEGKAKWDSQAEAIRKLVESNGMEVFSRYFRRLLVGNSPQIFPGINRNIENPGNYPLLVEEIEKVTRIPEQAQKIVETIETSDGDIFRDFDVSTFINHFQLDALAKTLLASAFTKATKADIRAKAGSVLSSNYPFLIQSLAAPLDAEPDIAPSLLATTAFKFLESLPDTHKNGTERERIFYALKMRYDKQQLPLPSEIRSAMSLIDLLGAGHDLTNELQRRGPYVTASVKETKDMLCGQDKGYLNEVQLAEALLFMVLTPDHDQYQPTTFITAMQELLPKSIDWEQVVHGFDRNGLSVSQSQFLTLYNTLLPFARGDPQFDIQALWGGRWEHPATQLSFVIAFTSLSPSQLDASTIPGLRQSYDPNDCIDGPKEVAKSISEACRNTMISEEAVVAIFDLVFDPAAPAEEQDRRAANDIVAANMGFFLCTAAGMPKPWTDLQTAIITQMLRPFLLSNREHYKFVLHLLWKQDKNWVFKRLNEAFGEDPIKLPILLGHAQEHGWLSDLYTVINGFGMDFAALAHREGILNIDDWAQEKLLNLPAAFADSLCMFLGIKTQDEMRTVRGEQEAPRTVRLAMKTVFAMLEYLEELLKDRPEELIPIERQCIQAFPRLINYGEGFDSLIEASGEERNSLAESTDAEMQDLYKRMYSAELKVEEIIEILQECKISPEPERQDLFACMVHGLFDEYVCFNEYPLPPLATTAVLFGGIIKHGLISNITLRVGLDMVLEAVRDYDQQTSMYKFGLQALLHFCNRLEEWPEYSRKLIQVPGLLGTKAYTRAQEALRENADQASYSIDGHGVNGIVGGMALTNGDIDSLLSSDTRYPKFRHINSDPVSSQDLYEDPDEEVHDKVLFVLNNVSEQNINEKLKQLTDTLEDKHYQWFANYLVEQRAKLQPNYQQLYLDLLELIGSKTLWSEVLHETYASIQRVMNAEKTMNKDSGMERKHVEYLAIWLGLLTVARDMPVKHKNISFKDLLFEGYETQRLLIVVPLVCHILRQGVKSVVFKPPNPWLMDIVRLLVELYHVPEMKINQKFAIEVLCNEFGMRNEKHGEITVFYHVNGDVLQPSQEIQSRQQLLEETLSGPMISDGMDGFDDLTIGNLNRGVHNARFSPAAIAATLPDLEPLLSFPPLSASIANQGRLRQIVQQAVHRAIMEIISPVVERSVTIATIATRDLIHKDFALEPDEDRVRRASQRMARALSGSLALVTCKEPLRMSMTNYIRMAQTDLPEQAFAEGAILMCVNDNLDTACSIVEKQAEERSMPEMEINIEKEIAKRRQYRLDYPNDSYRDPSYSHWSGYIPEPFKQGPGGLNQEQLDIYFQFARQSRGPNSHVQTSSTDSGRQIPDVLQDGFPAIPNLPTPAEPPAVPHQPIQQHQQQGRVIPPLATSTRPQGQMNGYMDSGTVQDHIQELMVELSRVSKDAPEKRLNDLPRESPVLEIIAQIQHLIVSISPNHDPVTMITASAVCSALYSNTTHTLEIEALVQLLAKLCQISPTTAKEVVLLFRKEDDEKLLNVPATISLLETGLMEFSHVDTALAKAIQQRKHVAINCLSSIMSALLLTNEPLALRADFANSLGAMGQWLSQQPDLDVAKDLQSQLKAAGVPEGTNDNPDDRSLIRQHQMQYVFSEWIQLCSHPDPIDGMFVAFISQLHQRQLLNSQEDMVLFLRLCIATSVEMFEQEDINPTADINEAYFHADALARLIVLLVRTQGEGDGAVKGNKSAYMNSILSLVALVLNNHHVMRGEQFNQRVFFRILSSILCDWYDTGREGNLQDREMILVFAENFLLLEPHYFPAFTYGWLSLVSHRIFMPAVLKLADDEGCEPFAKIMESMLSYTGELLKTTTVVGVAKELYRGVLRILLILHHDFPEFLAENHYRFCNIIPPQCTQLRNLVLSAYPSSFPELPDPFTAGLKVDRLEEIRKAPIIAGDVIAPLRHGNIRDIIDRSLHSSDISDENIAQINEAVYTESLVSDESRLSNVNAALIHAIVLCIGQSAISTVGLKGGPSFTNNSPHAFLMSKLAREMHPEARYYFLSAIANQLRYPNSHTHYFSYALLHLFGSDLADQEESDVRQQITRVLLERLIVHRPHPWGLIITLLELLKNPTYMFWDLPFIKAAPEIERLFGALFQHINQSPRNLV